MNWNMILSPQGCDSPQALVLAAHGATLLINGAVLDLSFLGDGDTLPAGAIDHPLLQSAEIRRQGDTIEIDGLLFPISLNQTDPTACFPEPIFVTGDGPITLPPQFPPEPEPTPEPEQQDAPNADQH
ncbi:hypothetical protein [Alcaligenes sp. SDU_A2]|uniref:hypothetical protein n=1 Tax=Alcaligenes sp. SDU_A2 TaxID=3136634 RepID=UPI00311D7ACF